MSKFSSSIESLNKQYMVPSSCSTMNIISIIMLEIPVDERRLFQAIYYYICAVPIQKKEVRDIRSFDW